MKSFLSLIILIATQAAGQSIVNSYTDVYGQAVTYQGCFVDGGPGNRVLPLPPGPSAPAAMTVAACGLACGGGPSGQQLNYFGVEYGGECYCGNASTSIASLTTSSNCNMACVGNSSTICGGSNAINIYSQTLLSQQPSASFTVNATTYNPIACAINRLAANYQLNYFSQASTGVTIDACIAGAIAGGFPYFGMGNASTCLYLSVQNLATLQQPMNKCNVTSICTGNPLQLCVTNGYWNMYTTPGNLTAVPAFTSQISYTSASGNQWTYSNCYADSNSNRVLPFGYQMALLTPQRCMDVCGNNGYAFAGIEAGNECRCGNSPASGASLMASVPLPSGSSPWTVVVGTVANPNGVSLLTPLQGGCNVQCGGNASLACGGLGSTAIFSTTSTNSTLPNYTDYKNQTVSLYGSTGCYADNSTNSPQYRIFPVQVSSISANAMTQGLCTQACSSLAFGPFVYSGLQYGRECWCSNTPPVNALPLSSCNIPCSGNSSQICGAGNSMLVFSSTPPANISVVTSYGNIQYLGYFNDVNGASLTATYTQSQGRVSINAPIRLLPAWIATNINMTVEYCVGLCTNLSMPYSGVQNVYGCYCGLTFNPVYGAGTSLPRACNGANKEMCGSADGNNVYYNPNIATLLPVPYFFNTTVTTSSSYYGCVVDSVSNRAFNFRVYPTQPLTPQVCLDTCYLAGYLNAGVEFGSECYCGTNANRLSQSYINHADCIANGMPCPGNSSLSCGAGNRLAVYQIGNGAVSISIQSSVNGYTSSGCFVDSIASRTLRYRMSLSPSAMTPTACTAACAASGYYYAGVEYASECWCDNAIQNSRSALASTLTCQTPCTGTASYYCGGGNAIIIYYNSALTRTTLQTYTTTQSGSSGIVWNYKACWGEPAGGRGLPNPLNNNAIGTVQSCLEMGSAAGYNACGLEYGGECWCNSIAGNPYGGQVPESMCQTNGMVCRGNSLNYCGAGNIFSFYSTGVQSYTLF